MASVFHQLVEEENHHGQEDRTHHHGHCREGEEARQEGREAAPGVPGAVLPDAPVAVPGLRGGVFSAIAPFAQRSGPLLGAMSARKAPSSAVLGAFLLPFLVKNGVKIACFSPKMGQKSD